MELRPGILLGPYCLVEAAGWDGPVEIWLAKQLGLVRPVDISFLPLDDGSRPGYLDRFKSEATRLVRLNHLNILTMRDFGVLDGRPYLVTPRVGGLTLDWLLGEPWPLVEALEVIEPIASALDYLHARGVVLRDLRPTRVLISDAGILFLATPRICWM